MDFMEKRCWAEIDLSQLKRNFIQIQKASAPAQVIAVIKGDAYGHGDVPVAKALAEAGAQHFAVATLTEALHLRNHGIAQPLLILGVCQPEHAPLLAQHNIQQCVPTLEYAQQLSRAACKAGATIEIHCKADTGMHRIGLPTTDAFDKAVSEMEQICRLPNLKPVGLFTHFSVADSCAEDDVRFTKTQAETLLRLQKALQQKGICFPQVHCCNSGGIITQPQYKMDAVRPGIILFGCQPSQEVGLAGIAPILQLKACITMVKDLPKGGDVSYGRTFTAKQNMRVATLAVGYADGYIRALSNKGIVGIHGKPARVLGRVCMDQIVVDVTDIPDVKRGDIATIYGADGADSAEDAAQKAGTISYEIFCMINRRVPRLYFENDKQVTMVDYLED